MAGALREVLARFGVSFDSKELEKGDKAVDGVAAKLANFGKLLGGALVVKGISDFITGMAEQADVLAKQSIQLGLSTTQLQEWQHAAGLSGVAGEELTSSFMRLQRSASDAAEGAGAGADTFRKLGVSVKDSGGQLKTADQLMTEVAGAIGGLKNPTEKTAAAMTIFGRSGAKLIPLFNEGADGIAKLRGEVDEFGGGFSPEFAKRSEEMNDNLSRLNLAWTSFKVRLGGLVIPLVTRFALLAAKTTARISKWADSFMPLIENSNLVVAAAVAIGGAFLVAGAKALAPWIPLLATLAALVIVGDELVTFFQGGDSLIGRGLDAAFGEGTQGKVRAWFEGVYKTVSELFTNTEQAFFDFDAGIRLMWFDLTTWLGDAWADTVTGMTLIFVKIGQDIEYIIAGIEDTFAEAINGINDTIDKIPGAKKLLGTAARLDTNRQGKVKDDFDLANQRALNESDARRAKNAAERQAIIDSSVRPARATAPVAASGTSTTNNVTNAPSVTVNVPAGTPPQQARGIADGVRRALQPSMKGLQNQLVKTAG